MSEDAAADSVPRAEYGPMVSKALALFDEGLDRRAVIERCYGVAFPDEFYRLLDAGTDNFGWALMFTDLPWQLAIPPAAGGPAAEMPTSARREGVVYARDRDLVPLVVLYEPVSRYGGNLACYRLSELGAGRSAIVLVDDWQPGAATDGADSLLEMLRLHLAAGLDELMAADRDPANARVPLVDDEDLDRARDDLRLVEELIRSQ